MSQSSHAPLASLAVHWHACKGDVPPPLVGASVTLVDDGSYLPVSSPSSSTPSSQGKVYLFGGRLVSTRRMVNDMYILDLTTLHWTRHTTSKDDVDTALSSVPQPRYFHSCDIWNGKLIIFGGMGYGKDNDAELCVLNEVIAFDLETQRWELDFQSPASEQDETLSPQPRYAHLSSITAHSLVVIGGQDMGNHYVETINVFDLQKRTWVIAEAFGKQRGGYRSLAVGPTWIVDEHIDVNSRRPSVKTSSASPSSTSHISLLPTSRKGYDEEGKERRLPIYVYTNYNFTDVKREMEMIQLQDKDGKEHITITDQSGPMNGVSLPPGLRFPMGAVLGNFLIISGTYLANTSQTFAIWTLYLPKMTWSRLDVGPLLASGSWNRGLLWANKGRLLVFGNRDRDLVSDYNHRQTNWDHVFLIELEAWGITQPPSLAMSSASIQLGLQKLASSMLGSLRHSLPNQKESNAATSLCLGNRGDFEIICSDGMKLGCDRIILEKRWPWFADRMRDYRSTALEESRKVNSKDGLLTNEIKGLILDDSDDEDLDDAKEKAYSIKSDIRITPRQLYMGEPSPVVLALLVYLYTRSLCTSTQRQPAIVAALLVISKVYKMDDLQKWAKHAAHISLSTDLAAPIGSDTSTPTSASPVVSDVHFHLPPLERHRLAVAMYEAATICGLEALQIRALRTVMSIAKWVQRSSVLASRNLYDAESTADASYTPTTGALQSDGAVLQQMQRDLSPSSTRMTSPASRKRTSMGRTSVDSYETEEAAAVGTVNMARKLSKAERMLGMSGADVAASSSSPSLMSVQGRGVVDSRLAPIRTRADRANSQSQLLAPYAAPSSVSTRRPSAPGLVTSHPPSSLLHPRTGTTTTDYASSNNRKRFSIFGKASERTAGPDQLLDSPAEEKGNIFDQRSIYRINGDMSTTTETSLASLQGTMSDSSSSNIGLPPPALSEKDMRRIEKGKLSTLNRLKASALKSIDTSYTPYDNVSMSNNGSSISIAKALPAGSQTSTYNSLHNNNRLNDQELKALYSIS